MTLCVWSAAGELMERVDHLMDPRYEIDDEAFNDEEFYECLMEAFYHALYPDDKGHTCDTCSDCSEPLPEGLVRWRCASCDWDCCLRCADGRLDIFHWGVSYDLPPVTGESKADQQQRKQRHRQREMVCIRELDGDAAARYRARKAAQDRERHVRREQQGLTFSSSAPLASWGDFWDQLE
jgi:hypothetical protein